MSDKDDVADALERFRLAYDNEAENRRLALADMKFSLLAEQWDERDIKARREAGRPVLTINRMQAIGRQVINDARQNKPSIKVRPVDSNADVKTAGIYDGLIRNIEQTSNASVAYDTGIEGAVYGGFGYWRVKTDYAHDDSFDLDICIERVANPFSVYGCPYSQAADASDWCSAFIVTQLSHDEYKRRFPGADLAEWEGQGDRLQHWFTDDMVQIAEEWLREEVKRKIVKTNTGIILDAEQWKKNQEFLTQSGLSVIGERETKGYKVTQRILSGTQVLEDSSEWAGKYIPIIPIYGDEINIEGKRYFKSLIRDAKDAQRMLNYWRTTSTELVALAPRAPYIGPKGAFDYDRRWETANTANHAYLEYDGPTAPKREPFAGVPAGALQEAMNASDDIKSITGLYDASLGAKSNETSGRAIMARQREGDTATFHFIDNQQRAIRYTGQVIIDLIPKVYTGERMLRVLGDDGKADMVQVNNGVIDLARGKYDLVVQSGPSYTTKREEFANTMIEFTRSTPGVFPIVADKLVTAMDFPDAEVLAQRFKTMLPPQIQQMESQKDGQQKPEEMVPVLMGQLQQAQQQMQQMQQAMQEMQPERAKLQLETQKAQSDAQMTAQQMQQEAEFKAQDYNCKQQELALKAEQLALEREKFMAEQREKQQAHEAVLVEAGGGLVTEGDDETPPMTLAQSMAAMQQQNLQAQQALTQVLSGLQQSLQVLSAPRRAVRGPDGRIVGVEVAG